MSFGLGGISTMLIMASTRLKQGSAHRRLVSFCGTSLLIFAIGFLTYVTIAYQEMLSKSGYLGFDAVPRQVEALLAGMLVPIVVFGVLWRFIGR